MPTRVLLAYLLIAVVVLAVSWAIYAIARDRRRERDLRRGAIGEHGSRPSRRRKRT